MHELARAERDADVRWTAADGLEEDQVSCLHIVPIELVSRAVLLSGFAREDRPMLGEDPLHEPTAIEPARRI